MERSAFKSLVIPLSEWMAQSPSRVMKIQVLPIISTKS